jgi:hypothetical protein
MKLVSIEHHNSTERSLVNTQQICSIFIEFGNVMIVTSDNRRFRTKFTDLDHAADYIHRSAFVPAASPES